MAIFDQRGQRVNYQYNAAGNISFGAVETKADVAVEIEKFLPEVSEALSKGILEEDKAIEVESKIRVAVIQARKLNPDKKKIIDYLTDAKTLLEGITAAAGLAMGLSQAIEAIRKLF